VNVSLSLLILLFFLFNKFYIKII